jgi:hypothetical protein
MAGPSEGQALDLIRSWVANYLTNAGFQFEEMGEDHLVFVYDDEVPGQPIEINVGYITWGDQDEHISIVVSSIVLAGAESSPELDRYVATQQPHTYGTFRVQPDGDGEFVVYDCQMPADFQNWAEFQRAFNVVFATFVGQLKAAEKEFVHLFGKAFDEQPEIERLDGLGASAEQIEHLRTLLERQAEGLTRLARLIGMIAKSDLDAPTRARAYSTVAKATDDLMPRLERLIRDD